MSCSKKIKYDKYGKVVQETDVSNSRYQAAKRDFFNENHDKGSIGKKK